MMKSASASNVSMKSGLEGRNNLSEFKRDTLEYGGSQ